MLAKALESLAGMWALYKFKSEKDFQSHVEFRI